MTETKVCQYPPCGATFTRVGRTDREWQERRFCSRACGVRGKAVGELPRLTHCRSGRHELIGDNVRTDKRGRRSCRVCAAERDAARRGAPRRGTGAPPRRAPKDPPKGSGEGSAKGSGEPEPPAAPTPPRWRPAGWAPEPVVRPGQPG